MSNLTKEILSNIGKEKIDNLFSKYNIKKNKEKASTNIISLFLAQLSKNIQNQNEAEKIVKVLSEDHKDTLEDFKKNNTDEIKKTGEKILNHIFKNDNKKVFKKVLKESKTKKENKQGFLEEFAPLILGGLAKTTNKAGIKDSNILSNILKMATSSEISKNKSLFKGLLDIDGDGNIIDDIPFLFSKIQKILQFFKNNYGF